MNCHAIALPGGDPRSADKLVVDMLKTMHEPIPKAFAATIAEICWFLRRLDRWPLCVHNLKRVNA